MHKKCFRGIYKRNSSKVNLCQQRKGIKDRRPDAGHFFGVFLIFDFPFQTFQRTSPGQEQIARPHPLIQNNILNDNGNDDCLSNY